MFHNKKYIMNKVEERQKKIKDILGIVESISTETLAERMNVTGATIRKDLRDMESRHEIIRNRGQVSLARKLIVDRDIMEKIFINADKKNIIGAAAAELITPGDSIIVTSGSTIDAFVRHLEAKGSLNVVTPSVSVAMTMTYKDGVSVVILGGSVIRNSMSTRDSYCLEGLRNINCSKLFFSCDGLDFATGVITAFLDEARLTQAMTEHAKSIVLLADSSKFGKTGFGKICELRDIDILVTDEGLPDSVRTKLEELGVHVIIARERAFLSGTYCHMLAPSQ